MTLSRSPPPSVGLECLNGSWIWRDSQYRAAATSAGEQLSTGDATGVDRLAQASPQSPNTPRQRSSRQEQQQQLVSPPISTASPSSTGASTPIAAVSRQQPRERFGNGATQAQAQTQSHGRHIDGARQQQHQQSPQRRQRQQEPGSEAYLAKLLRRARCAAAQPANATKRKTPDMADFLASFNFGAQPEAQANDAQCASVEDLQLRIRGILDAKTTPTRAEHVAVSLQLPPSVQFALSLSEQDNEALEGLTSIDPTLGGLTELRAVTEQEGQHPTKVVGANEALSNQPIDDPILQKSVAKHIIGALGSVDGSGWTVREVSRDSNEWTFTYLCKDSWQQWSRHNAKAMGKTVVGEYSHKEQDPVIASRPAFDCRGSLVISFSRRKNAITIKYDHTPMHKTVAELTEYYKPTPRQLGPGAQKMQQKTPKKTAAEKKNGSEKRPKKRRSAANEDGEGAKPPRKSKKKQKDAEGRNPAEGGPVMPPDHHTALPVGGLSQQDVPYGSHTAQNGQDFGDYPRGLMEGGSADEAAAAGASANVRQTLNVTPEEAARRRDTARTLLSNAGVDPDTLSADQFSIFSNQSPELQKESLNMLVKYGAERLRIVHPTNREGSAPASSSTTQSPTSETAAPAPTTTKELVPQSEASARPNGSTTKKRKSGAAQTETDTPSRSRRGPGKSRVACYPCKSRKVKASPSLKYTTCQHEKPSCAECEAEGLTCEYPPVKPRKRKSEAIVQDEDEDADEAEDEQPSEPQADHGDPSVSHHPGQDLGTPDSYTQMPVADLLTPNVEPPNTDLHPSQTYFPSVNGLALPRTDRPGLSQHGLSTAPGLMPQGQQYNMSSTEAGQHMDDLQQAHGHGSAVPLPLESPKQQKKSKARQSHGSGRAKAKTANNNGRNSPMVNTTGATSGWASVNNGSHSAQESTTTHSPLMPAAQTHNRHSARDNVPLPMSNPPQIHDGMQNAAALSQAAAAAAVQQQQQQQSPVLTAAMEAQARASPFQLVDNPRMQPGAGQRSQPRTPVADNRAPSRNSNVSDARSGQQQQQQQQVGGAAAAARQSVGADISGLSAYGGYGRFPFANNNDNGASSGQPSNPLNYNNYQPQGAASNSSYPSYNYNRNIPTTVSMGGQPVTTISPAQMSNNAPSSQWPEQQSRNSRSSMGGAGNSQGNSRSFAQMGSGPDQPSAALPHGLGNSRHSLPSGQAGSTGAVNNNNHQAQQASWYGGFGGGAGGGGGGGGNSGGGANHRYGWSGFN